MRCELDIPLVRMVIPCAHVGAPACAQLAHYPNPGVVYLDHDIVGGGAREMPHLESVGIPCNITQVWNSKQKFIKTSSKISSWKDSMKRKSRNYCVPKPLMLPET